jgi:hypothetical protein
LRRRRLFGGFPERPGCRKVFNRDRNSDRNSDRKRRANRDGAQSRRRNRRERARCERRRGLPAFSGAPPASARAARAIAFGAAFAVVAPLAALVGLAFLAGAGYLALLDTMAPRFAALAVAVAALAFALIAALIGRALVHRGARRLRAAIGASALVAIAPHALRFGLRNAKLVGLASTAAATYFALRGARKTG